MSHDEQEPPYAPRDVLKEAEDEARAALESAGRARADVPAPSESGPVLQTPPRVSVQPRPATHGFARPSFFPEESPEQSRAFLDELVPSLRPATVHTQSSGLYATSGLRTSEDGEDQDISTVVLLHTRDHEAEAPSAADRPSMRAGLISSLLGQEQVLAEDQGALAALRTLPLRLARDQAPPLVGPGSEATRARLLSHLAERSDAKGKARLHLAAAELHAQAQDHESARAANQAAHLADPTDALALRRHLQDVLRAAELERACELLRQEAQLDSTPEERALSLLLLAELEQSCMSDVAAAEHALQEARHAHPGSLGAGLALASLCVKDARLADAAEALRRSGEFCNDPMTAAALFLHAARLLERIGEFGQALPLFARAKAVGADSFAGALGTYRSARAMEQRSGAERALETLAEQCIDPKLRAEITRQRARLLHDGMAEPERALPLFETVSTLAAARGAARAAETLRDQTRQRAALLRWAELSFGSERGLALVELAILDAKNGDLTSYNDWLREASFAGAPAALLQLAHEALSGLASTTQGRAPADADGSEVLRAAARLARDPTQAKAERELLRQVGGVEHAELVNEALTFDSAAEHGDLQYLRGAVQRTSATLAPGERAGRALALLDLFEERGAEAGKSEVFAILHELRAFAPVLLRRIASASADPSEVAALWLEEAEAASGEHAAFAATMAGRYLERAGADPLEAYVEALDAVRGYPPACFALEAAARRQGDVLALERAHRELATTTAAPTERAARRARLALLSAETDAEAAIGWLEDAAADHPGDVLIADLITRLSAEAPAAERAERMRSAAALESAPNDIPAEQPAALGVTPIPAEQPAALGGDCFARAMQLRAASACEDAGLWGDAIAIYDDLLASDATDSFARLGRTRALHLAGRHDQLVAETELALLGAQTVAARKHALEVLAEIEEEHGQLGRARVALETLLEADPNHVPTLRSLARLAMQDGDATRVLSVTERLWPHLRDAEERAAELRLALRLRGTLGHGSTDDLLLAAEDLVRQDLSYALALEAFALRTEDRARFYEAAATVSSLLSDPSERAAYALRAAETFEAAAPARAASELGEALLGAPQLPLAVEELARLYRAGGNTRAAAETFARAATLAHNLKHAAQLFHSAAVLFEDELGDTEHALSALASVVTLDVVYADSFARMHRLLRGSGDKPRLLWLLERRLLAPAGSEVLSALHAERARLFQDLAQREQAKEAWRASLAADVLRPEPLRALAELHLADGEHKQAAEALIHLARVTTDEEVLAFAFYELGILYTLHLPDPRRAEIAFTRVLSLAPDDDRPVQQLIALWRRQKDFDRALRALGHLIAKSRDPKTREGYVIDLAQTLLQRGDARAAEQTLEEARRAAPASVPVLEALSALYEAQDDNNALAIHRSRSCHALRAAIEADPADLAAWLGLIAMLEARGRNDGAALVARAALALGLVHDDLTARRAPAEGLGPDALQGPVQRKLALRGPLDAMRTLLQTADAELRGLLSCEAARSASVLPSSSGAVRTAQKIFDLPELILLATSDGVCVPVASQPMTVLVGQECWQQATDGERFFLLLRALAAARQGFTLLLRATPERVLLVVHALKMLGNPAHTVAAVDMTALSELTRELAAALSQPKRRELAPLLAELFAEGECNPRRLAALALDQGARTALCFTDDVASACDALLRQKGHDPQALGANQRTELTRSDPALRALLSFAVSEAYLEVRREALAQSRPETR